MTDRTNTGALTLQLNCLRRGLVVMFADTGQWIAENRALVMARRETREVNNRFHHYGTGVNLKKKELYRSRRRRRYRLLSLTLRIVTLRSYQWSWRFLEYCGGVSIISLPFSGAQRV